MQPVILNRARVYEYVLPPFRGIMQPLRAVGNVCSYQFSPKSSPCLTQVATNSSDGINCALIITKIVEKIQGGANHL